MWWQQNACNGQFAANEGIQFVGDGDKVWVGMGVSWWLLAFGGLFNVVGSMLSFKNPDERLKKAKAKKRKRAATNLYKLDTATSTSFGTQMSSNHTKSAQFEE